MLKLRINPIVAKDLKNIRDYIAEDSEEYAAKTIKEIYGKFENLQMFPGMGSDLSKRVSFRTDYKYAIWEDYVIIYKVSNEYLEIYRVVNRYQDITSVYSCAGVPLFRRNGNRQSGGRKPLNRNRDTALKCLLPASLLA